MCQSGSLISLVLHLETHSGICGSAGFTTHWFEKCASFTCSEGGRQKKGLSKVPAGTVQCGLGCPVRADEPGAMGASEAAGPGPHLAGASCQDPRQARGQAQGWQPVRWQCNDGQANLEEQGRLQVCWGDKVHGLVPGPGWVGYMLGQRRGCRIAWTGTKDNSLWFNAASTRSKCSDAASFCKTAGHSGLVVVIDRQFYMLIVLQSELTCLSAAGLFSPNEHLHYVKVQPSQDWSHSGMNGMNDFSCWHNLIALSRINSGFSVFSISSLPVTYLAFKFA